MEIHVNGEARQVAEGARVADLVQAAGLQPGLCAVAVNLDFVPRTAYATTTLQPGDRVEIVTPRQGG